MKMNEPHFTLRQAQGEDLMSGLSEHKVRDIETRFLERRIRRAAKPRRLEGSGRRPAQVRFMKLGSQYWRRLLSLRHTSAAAVLSATGPAFSR